MSNINEGIYLEFTNKEFVLSVVDEKYVQEEIDALHKNGITLYYVSMGIVDLFLLNIDDSIDTSDIPFCVFDYQEDASFLASLDENECYFLTIQYVNLKGEVVNHRKITLSKEFSDTLRLKFKQNSSLTFDEESYEASLMKIQAKYEPFELEEKATIIYKV